MYYNLDNEIVKRSNKSVYRDNDNTIKLFVENYSKADILNEALNQARVEEGTDLKITKLREITKIDNRWALISDYIEGTSLENLMNNNPEKMDEYLEMFINIQLEVLSKHVPLLNRMKEKYRRRITNTELIDDNTRYELLQKFEMSNINKTTIQKWIPIVAVNELTKGKKEEEEFLRQWIDVVEY